MKLVTLALGRDGSRRLLKTEDLGSTPHGWDGLTASLPVIGPSGQRAGEQAWLVALYDKVPPQAQLEHGQQPNSNAFRKFCASKGWDERRDGSAWKWAHRHLMAVPDVVIDFGPAVLRYQEKGREPTVVEGRASLKVPAGFVQVGQVHDEVLLARTGDAACQRELDARATRIESLEHALRLQLSASGNGFGYLEPMVPASKLKAAEERITLKDALLTTIMARVQDLDRRNTVQTDMLRDITNACSLAGEGVGGPVERVQSIVSQRNHWRERVKSQRPKTIMDYVYGNPDFSIMEKFQADILSRSTTPIMMQFADEDGAKQYMEIQRLKAKLADAASAVMDLDVSLKDHKRVIERIRVEARCPIGASLVAHVEAIRAGRDDLVKCVQDLLKRNAFVGVEGNTNVSGLCMGLRDLTNLGDMRTELEKMGGAEEWRRVLSEILDPGTVLLWANIVERTGRLKAEKATFMSARKGAMDDMAKALGVTNSFGTDLRATAEEMRKELHEFRRRDALYCHDDARLKLASALGKHRDVHINTLAHMAAEQLNRGVGVDPAYHKSCSELLMSSFNRLKDIVGGPNFDLTWEELIRRVGQMKTDREYTEKHRVNIWVALGRVFDSEKCDPTWAQVREEAHHVCRKALAETALNNRANKLLGEEKAKVKTLAKFFERFPAQYLEQFLNDMKSMHLEEVRIDDASRKSRYEYSGSRAWEFRFRA